MNASVQAALTGNRLDPLLADQINRAMMSVERQWLIPEGIPGRPGYKHMLYACRKPMRTWNYLDSRRPQKPAMWVPRSSRRISSHERSMPTPTC